MKYEYLFLNHREFVFQHYYGKKFESIMNNLASARVNIVCFSCSRLRLIPV